jgi:hypothetical protein
VLIDGETEFLLEIADTTPWEALEIDGVEVTVQANGRGHKIALVAVAARSRKYLPEAYEVAREMFWLVESIASCVETKSDHRELAFNHKTFEQISRDCLRDRREWQIRRSG